MSIIWINFVLELGYGLDSFLSLPDAVADSCEHDIELAGSIKGNEILDHLKYCRLLRKYFVPIFSLFTYFLGN
jgi:hypothetical protein